MNKLTFLSVCTLVIAMGGCGKHKCDLKSDADKQAFGDIAAMTGGAFSCFVSNNELVASHGRIRGE